MLVHSDGRWRARAPEGWRATEGEEAKRVVHGEALPYTAKGSVGACTSGSPPRRARPSDGPSLHARGVKPLQRCPDTRCARADCTCPMEAEPMGLSSNHATSASTGFPSAVETILCTSAGPFAGTPFCRTTKAARYASGIMLVVESCWPSLTYRPRSQST